MPNVLENASQITPRWLTGVLREQGVLPHGEVTAVTPRETRAAFASQVWWLSSAYSKDAAPDVPQKLFLKISNPSLSPGTFDPSQLAQEVNFYRKAAPAMGESFTIPCYHAAYDPETGAGAILLKDVSDTHAPCPNPAGSAYREQAVDVLARLHAFWWDHPRLGKDIGQFVTPEERAQDCAEAEKSTRAFIAEIDDRLPAAYRNIYERALSARPALFQRHATRRNLTLAHGDSHLGNFLFPKDTQAGGAYLLDWQFWHVTINSTDLAFMLVASTDIDSRRREELGLLRRYYQQIQARGIQGYTWDDCWNDYRLSVILDSIFIPVWRWSFFQWEPDFTALERGMTAYEDLACDELVKGC